MIELTPMQLVRMGALIRVTWRRDNFKVKGHLTIQMAGSMKENGLWENHMEKAFTLSKFQIYIFTIFLTILISCTLIIKLDYTAPQETK